MNAALFFHPRYEAHRVFASEEVKALLQLWNKAKQRGVPGAAWPYVARAIRAPHRLAVALARKLVVRHGPARRWRMRAAFETGFRYDNRVTLSDERDRLGRRRVRIEWRIADADVEKLSLDLQLPNGRGVELLRALQAGKHHMGTTRMHRAPRHGVVDENSRVHGTSNLFATGSSVFPSGGYANPTLTIVALAVRLGDHLRRVVSG